jgi:hypothetical protein
MAKKLGYRASLDWILDNDDTEWLHDDEGVPSVAICLVADIFDVDTEKAVTDLRRRDTNRRVADSADAA